MVNVLPIDTVRPKIGVLLLMDELAERVLQARMSNEKAWPARNMVTYQAVKLVKHGELEEMILRSDGDGVCRERHELRLGVVNLGDTDVCSQRRER